MRRISITIVTAIAALLFGSLLLAPTAQAATNPIEECLKQAATSGGTVYCPGVLTSGLDATSTTIAAVSGSDGAGTKTKVTKTRKAPEGDKAARAAKNKKNAKVAMTKRAARGR